LRLTAYTNYALRTLMYCALHPNQLVRIQDVAEAHGISKAHLLKAARQLGQLGYLENVRGRAGGVRLGRPPEKIIIGEVVRHTEGDLEVVECFNAATNTCPLIGVCKLSTLFRAGLRGFFSELDKVTLADIISNGPVLLERLERNRALPTAC
jgi:Rrf2 family nitric oxide-sensitive transcriptional repressor